MTLSLTDTFTTPLPLLTDTFMMIIRLFLALISLGVAAFLGCTAYGCWAVSRNWGRGNLDLLGVSIPFPLGMVLLVTLALLFVLGAIYAFFYHDSKN